METEEKSVAKQEEVGNDEVVSNDEEAVESPKTKQKRSWKFRLLIISIFSLLSCSYIYLRIYQTPSDSSKYISYGGGSFEFASAVKYSDLHKKRGEPPTLEITNAEFKVYDETTNWKDLVVYLIPPLQQLSFFKTRDACGTFF